MMKRVSLLLAMVIVGFGSVAPHVSADSGIANWQAEFYDNPYLLGTSVVTNVNAVSFDWGASAPFSGVGADNFSARFTTRTLFNTGTYQFFARADDQVRVSVDSQVLIDTFDASQVGVLLSGEVTLAAGFHEVRVDYREQAGDAYVFVTWEAVGDESVVSPNFAPITTTTERPVSLPPWLVQYYANTNLSGFPSAIFSEQEITEDWGQGSPAPSVPADDFSARWTNSATLDAGRYRITARADDGVRVFVDGQTVIDEWVNAVGVTTTRDIDLPAGQHTIVVEYYERGREAYIEFSFAQVDETQTIPTAVPAVKVPNTPLTTNASGTVDAYRLNVRAAPSTDAGIVAKIERGETHDIVGRNADNTWWQVNVDGTVGWVFADFLISTNTAQVPVTSSSSQQQTVTTTGLMLTATGTVNLRSTPSRRGAVLGLLPRGAQAEIIGRNQTGSWVQVSYNGTVAWVSQSFVNLPVATSEIPLATP